MPVGVVRSRADELAWEHAKELARRQYPFATGSDFYRIVMGIYKKMTHYQPKRSRAASRRFRALNGEKPRGLFA